MANHAITTYQKKQQTIRDMLHGDKMQAALRKALGEKIPVDYYIITALSALNEQPKLYDCTSSSLAAALIAAAQLGLIPDRTTGQAYLVPFGTQAQLIPGYRGLLDLARDHPDVSRVTAHVVASTDVFEFSHGTDDRIVHRYNLSDERNRDELIGAYAVMWLKSGDYYFDIMSRKEIDRIRSISRAGKSGPWKDHFPEMAKKTVIKRFLKTAHRNVRLDRAIALDNKYEAGEPQNLRIDDGGDFIDIPAEPTPDEEAEILAQEKAEAERQPGDDG